jgi:hypothetical protein
LKARKTTDRLAGLSPAVDALIAQALDEETLSTLEGLLGVPSPTPLVRDRLQEAVRSYLLTTMPADRSGDLLMVRWAHVRRDLDAIQTAAADTRKAVDRLATLLDPLSGTDDRDRTERDRARGMIQAVGGNVLAADMLRLGENLRNSLALLDQIEKAAREAPRRIPTGGPRRGPGRRDALVVPLLAELILLIEEHHGAEADAAYVDRTEDRCAGLLFNMVDLISARLPQRRGTLAGRSPRTLVRTILRYRPAARQLAHGLAQGRQRPE